MYLRFVPRFSISCTKLILRGGAGFRGKHERAGDRPSQLAVAQPSKCAAGRATCDLFEFSSTAWIDFILKNWQCGSWAPPPERVGTRDSYKKLGFKWNKTSALTRAGGAIGHMYDRAVIHMTDRDVRA